ncbi:hypothetical protein HWV00_06070 [Moritella sp. 24]|uniref:hypothetical protein n=1 Tax=Moritella sp. 24 TaxID=2746230 RepID=UPI001BACE91D|nr:hypothetical protein [Moritella sp. 24]QUM75832.1 hypothetical protein HWV00_06070 [Moritella sp. 24]
MKTPILALSLVLASTSLFANESIITDTQKEKSNGVYINAGQFSIGDNFEILNIGVGYQETRINNLFWSVGGQAGINMDLPDDEAQVLVSAEGKLGYSFNNVPGQVIQLIPYVGVSVGADVNEDSYSSGSEFFTKVFVGGEIRLTDTVGVYFNQGMMTISGSNKNFSELGARISF